MSIKEYFKSIFKGIYSLLQGMQVTGKELVTKKVTEQYPENRNHLLHEGGIPERFRASLEFIYDDEGYHKCIACKSCERNCPNGTIQVITKMVDLPNGKKKMKLDRYMYDLGSCTFCNLCVLTCPTAAIRFSNDFEQSTFEREALVKQLNYLPEKEKPVPAPAPKPAPAVAKPAEAQAKPAAEPTPQAKSAEEPTPQEKPAAAPDADKSPDNTENKENKQ